MTSILALLIATSAYFLIGLETPFGYAIQGMNAVLFILGIWGKISKKTTLFTQIAFLALGVGSVFLGQMFMPIYAMGARVVVLIIFIFVAISAIGAVLKILMAVAGIVGLVFALGLVSNSNNLDSNNSEEIVYSDDDTTQSGEESNELKTEEKPEDILKSHSRKWRDLQFNAYQGKLQVWEAEYGKSHQHRKGYNLRYSGNSKQYWGKVYQELLDYDTPFMDKTLEMFMAVGKDKGLNQLQFAQMVVSCVQDIPYVLIYREPCSNLENETLELQELAREYGCKGNVKFGLQAPAEFVYDLQGDCDTRTVFLFAILNKLGYKVSILNSEVYGHSMLGIGISAKGKAKNFRGTNYYFWETTTKGWDIGVLPPEMGNVNHWDVIISN